MNFSTQATATDLVNQINGIFSLKEEDSLKKIVAEFNKHGIDYRNLIIGGDKINLNSPLKLVNSTLFELNIPFPPMTSKFFPVIMKLADFFTTHAEGKELITLDYILSQLFVTKEKVALSSDLNQINNKQLFIGLKSRGKYYPELNDLNNNSAIKAYFIVEKSEAYRGLNSVTFYKNNQIVEYLELK